MRRSPLLLALLLLTIAGCSSSRLAVQPGEQVARVASDAAERSYSTHHLVYLPDGYGQRGRTWPLVIFLHGAGERGDDLEQVAVHGPPKRVAQGDDFPFILISPQVPAEQWWDAAELDALLDYLLATYAVDETRVYLTGLSMGGFGAWIYGAAHPERVAALAPICGGGSPGDACALKNMPIWAFHGDADEVVPLQRSVEMVEAVNECGGDARLTVYEGVGHDSWTATYDDPEFYNWLLSHRLSN